MSNAYQVVRDLEAAICEYTGAPFCVTTNSCTMALTLAVAWHFWKDVPEDHVPLLGQRRIEIPKRTYVSVPMAIIHAGGRPTFRNEGWLGSYRLKPLPVWDSARDFTSGMYRGKKNVVHQHQSKGDFDSISQIADCAGQMVCTSFHASKILGDTQGGAILHDNPEADAWLRRARFDGRTEGVAPKDDTFNQIGWHCYMSPDVAARLLWKLQGLPRHNPDLPRSDYPDLSQLEAFR
jgi:dTDP-4-amino-4,6-dideoxygalactose transaminase